MTPPRRPQMPTGLNHLVLNVRDIEESHRFWSDILGFTQVGELHPRPGDKHPAVMRFYSGSGGSHHDLALVEQRGVAESPKRWFMFRNNQAVNHVAITYPDRESWLAQLEYMKAEGVPFNLRIDHGMTHSLYTNDPNGYGVEVLYELPREVWEHDVDGALNYAVVHPIEKSLEDDTDYERDFTPVD